MNPPGSALPRWPGPRGHAVLNQEPDESYLRPLREYIPGSFYRWWAGYLDWIGLVMAMAAALSHTEPYIDTESSDWHISCTELFQSSEISGYISVSNYIRALCPSGLQNRTICTHRRPEWFFAGAIVCDVRGYPTSVAPGAGPDHVGHDPW